MNLKAIVIGQPMGCINVDSDLCQVREQRCYKGYSWEAVDEVVRKTNSDTALLCKSFGLGYYNVIDEIPPTLKNFSDGLHLTDAGIEKLAQIYVDIIACCCLKH